MPPEPGMCPDCKGTRRKTCTVCGGEGWVWPEEEPEAELDEAVWASVADAVEMFGLIERHGVDGAMRLAGVRAFDPVFVEALGVLGGEIGELEQADRVAEAVRRKREAAARK